MRAPIILFLFLMIAGFISTICYQKEIEISTYEIMKVYDTEYHMKEFNRLLEEESPAAGN